MKCFEPDLKETLMKETDNCRYTERPQAFRSCNTQNCDADSASSTTETTVTTSTKQPIEPKVRLIQNDVDSTPSEFYLVLPFTKNALYD